MARARREANAQALEVVVRIVEGVDLELAAVARSGVDLADHERAAEELQHFGLDLRCLHAELVVRLGRRFADDAGADDLEEEGNHESWPE
jgi:hypothetical protein